MKGPKQNVPEVSFQKLAPMVSGDLPYSMWTYALSRVPDVSLPGVLVRSVCQFA